MRGTGGAAGEGTGGGVPRHLVAGWLDGCVLHVVQPRTTVPPPGAAQEAERIRDWYVIEKRKQRIMEQSFTLGYKDYLCL